METYRLKNIVILILVLLNICLLALVASRSYAGHQADQALITNTTALLQRNNISIDASLLEGTSSSLVYSYTRDDTAELEFVTALLGPITTQSDYGGGTHFYANANGSASFRSNGSFSLTMTSELYAENFREFVRTYCPAQYRLNTIQSDGDRTTVTATPYTDDFPVYNASITFIFEKQALISASGFLIPSAETAPDILQVHGGALDVEKVLAPLHHLPQLLRLLVREKFPFLQCLQLHADGAVKEGAMQVLVF